MKRIKEVMAKSSLKFRYSNSDKSPYYKTQKRTSKIHQRTIVVILEELLKMTYLPKAIDLKKMKLLCLVSQF